MKYTLQVFKTARRDGLFLEMVSRNEWRVVMKKVFCAYVMGLVGLIGLTVFSACQKDVSSSSRVNEAKDSNSIVMPDDLKGIAADFNSVVLSPESQEEFEFTMKIAELGKDVDTEYATKYILKATSESAISSEYSLEKIEVESLVDFSSTTYTEDFDKVMKTVFGSQDYFCTNYKNIDEGVRDSMGSELTEACKIETRNLLQKIAAAKLPVYFVHVVGNDYGDFEAAELWIGSKSSKGVFAKIHFDLVHEI